MNKILNIEEFPKRGKLINWRECKNLEVIVDYEDEIYKIKINNIYYDDKCHDYKIEFIYNDKIYLKRAGLFKNCQFRDVFKSKKMIENIPSKYSVDYEKCKQEFGYGKKYIDSLFYNTDVKLYFKCNECNTTLPKILRPRELFRRNKVRNCEFCGDGISYPEKLFFNIMKDIGKKYIKTSFEWSQGKVYDSYFEEENLIVELHGIQHYEENSNFPMSLGEQIENDILKENIAIKNGIKNYIQLDCRYSEGEYIKNSILNSELVNIFDFSSIDWDKVFINSEKSYIISVCNDWNTLGNHIDTITILTEKYNVSRTSIRRWLKKGEKIGLCKYDSEILKKEKYNKQQKNIITLND